MRWPAKILVITGAAWLAWAIADRATALMALPENTGGWFVSYANNASFGFGPGGNESGLNVVLLTSAGANRVAKGGAVWLNLLGDKANFGEWRETPVPHNDTWLLREGHAVERLQKPSIMALYLRYGFVINIPDRHLTAIDEALNSGNSYYTFDRQGRLILIVPKTKRAYVAYAG
jgi:hypothetical protein